MEEVSRRKKHTAAKYRRKLLPVFFLLAAVLLFVSTNNNMRPALVSIAEARINALAVTAMNDAILECMEESSSYADLVTAYENGERIYMLQADARQMNMLASDCCAAAQARIASLGEQGVSVPLGTLTGITYLSGRGPGINVSFTPVGSVYSEFRSELASSGINQSLYRVNIRLTSSIRLIMPGVSKTITASSEAAIAESIIVGEVPQVYTDVAEEDMLNLIPTEAP